MAVWDKKCLVAVGGPTASGKTAFSIALAKQLGGEVICADSMQIYAGLDVGTAKVTPEEAKGVPHHLVGFLQPDAPFSVADYVAKAGECVEAIHSRGGLPLLVGGTGLYIQSLLEGLRFAEQKTDPALRAALEAEAASLGPIAMHARLAAIDPAYAATVHPNNQGRVLRALELYEATGVTMTRQQADSRPQEPPYHALIFCLNWLDRAQLYQRIDHRVELMLGQGLLAEAEIVWRNKALYRTAAQAIGYKEFFAYFEGTASLPECAEKLKQASRNYAKRQITWFKRMEQVIWVDPGDEAAQEDALRLIQDRFLQ